MLRYAQELVSQLDAAEAAASSRVQEAEQQDASMHWFTSRLDHYDRATQPAYWQQRSFQNDTFFDGTGPVFLCVGGEGPAMDASVLIASVGSTCCPLRLARTHTGQEQRLEIINTPSYVDFSIQMVFTPLSVFSFAC
jgi:hypothetical protein